MTTDAHIVFEGWLLLREKHDANKWNLRYFQLLDNHELIYHKTDKRKQRAVRRIDLSTTVLHIRRYVVHIQDGASFQVDNAVNFGDPRSVVKALGVANPFFAPYFLDVCSEDRVWSLRFPDSDTRDDWFQELQIYVCDHLDLFAYHKGPIWTIDPIANCWTEAYGVCTACYILLFETVEQFKWFMHEQNELVALPDQRIACIKQRPFVVIPLQICSAESLREEVVSPSISSTELSSKYAFSLDCGGSVVQFAVEDEDESTKWLHAIRNSLTMFQLNANIKSFTSTTLRPPSTSSSTDSLGDSEGHRPKQPSMSFPSGTFSDVLSIPSVTDASASASSSHRNSHSSNHTLSYAPSQSVSSAGLPVAHHENISLEGPFDRSHVRSKSNQTSTQHMKFLSPPSAFPSLSTQISSGSKGMSAMGYSPQTSSAVSASPPKARRRAGNSTQSSNATPTRFGSDSQTASECDSPRVDEVAIKIVADQLRAALHQSQRLSRSQAHAAPKQKQQSATSLAAVAATALLSGTSSAGVGSGGHAESNASSPATASVPSSSRVPAPAKPSPPTHNLSPRGSPLPTYPSEVRSRRASESAEVTSDSDGCSTPSEVMESFRMTLLAAHLSLFKEFLKNGQILLKHSNSGRQHARRLRLENGEFLKWHRNGGVNIKDISQVVCPTKGSSKSSRRCFSIVTADDTLMFEAPSSDYRDYWVHGLRLMLADAKGQ